MSFTKHFFYLFCLAIIAFSTVDSFGKGTEHKELIQSIDSMIDNGEAKRALKLISNEISRLPTNLHLLNERAELYLFMERKEESREEIDNILAYDPDFIPAILTKAKWMFQSEKSDSAYHYIEQALDLGPDHNYQEGIYGLKGQIQIKEGKYKDAEKTLFKAARSPQVSMSTMKNLASVLNHNGKNDEAAVVLKETIEIFGHHVASYVNTGYVCNQLGLYDEAMDYLNEALAIEAINPYALANMAESYLRIGMVEEALKYASKSLLNDNTNAYAFKIKGECLLQMGEKEKACAEFTKSIQMGYSVTYDPEDIIKLVLLSCGFEG